MKITLSLTDMQHSELKRHLFPGDNKEAVVFALCGRRRGGDEIELLIVNIVPVAYSDCSVRSLEQVTWSTSILPDLLAEANKNDFAIIKVHSHPNGYTSFSRYDDDSDKMFFQTLDAWLDDRQSHASFVMLPDGKMFGRVMNDDNEFIDIASVKLVGDDIVFWRSRQEVQVVPVHGRRIAQAFGEGTYHLLRQLKIAVIGCSGTGSLVAEMLGRNCVGELVLIDPKITEEKNLNRIPQAYMKDAKKEKYKVHVIETAINAMELGTKVTALPMDLHNPTAIKAAASCDLVVGCMDSVEGRHLLNKLSSFYLLPYFDVGVKLVADGQGGVDQVCGSVHYIKPGGSSLYSRGMYSLEMVHAEALYRTDPEAYAEQFKDGYIEGVHVEKPAVMSVNMIYAALAVNEILARLQPFRLESNAEYARHTISLSHGIYDHAGHGKPCELFAKHVGRGDVRPLLYMPALSDIAAEVVV
jgi:ThiF family